MAARSSAPVIGALCSNSEPNPEASPHAEAHSPWSADHWSVSVGYRYQHSFRHFVGTTEQTERAIQHTEVVNYLNLFDVSLSYHFTPRWSLSLSMPIMNATRTYDHQLFQTLLHIPNAPDQVSHANGIGDIGVSAEFWLHRPPAEGGHNVAFSFGTVLPTGSSDVRDTVKTVNGPQRVFVDQSIQLGAGGYGISLGTEAYQRLQRFVLYASGTYLLTPQQMNGTPNRSLAGVRFASDPLTANMSIPDQYLADGGVAHPVPKIRGLAAKFGMRYEGVKVRDLLGGSLGFRRPGYALSVEPGAQYERGKTTWSLNIPVAVQRNRKRSVPDLIEHKAGDAAFADCLILVGYSRSF
ncbi:MAG: hypothetical protein JO356_14345 [Acidobacteria bacterium]|nr:hypothetical protein [Acidobacteriota bacterium]